MGKYCIKGLTIGRTHVHTPSSSFCMTGAGGSDGADANDDEDAIALLAVQAAVVNVVNPVDDDSCSPNVHSHNISGGDNMCTSVITSSLQRFVANSRYHFEYFNLRARLWLVDVAMGVGASEGLFSSVLVAIVRWLILGGEHGRKGGEEDEEGGEEQSKVDEDRQHHDHAGPTS